MWLRKDKIENIEKYRRIEKELNVIEEVTFRMKKDVNNYDRFRIFKAIEKIEQELKTLKFK